MKCRICDNSENNYFHNARENMFGVGESFEYFECSKCGCLQIVKFPDNMNKYYPNNYYSFTEVNSAAPSRNLKQKLIAYRDQFALTGKSVPGRFLNMIWPASDLQVIISKTGISSSSKILDVGSGSGSKIIPLKDAGLNIKGIDPFISEKISYPNGLTIDKISLDNVVEKFDLIMFNHVYEHLPDPLETLLKVNNLLLDNGKCLIRIPTVSSFAWKHYLTNWVQLDAPRHFFLHSIKSMELLAAKAGFSINKIIYDSTSFQFVGSELYRKNITFIEGDFSERDNKYFSDQQLLEFETKAVQLNKQQQGDQAAFILIKNKKGIK